MPDPVFSGGDRVDNSGYPADLQAQLDGKDVKDHARIISSYYSNRETQLLNEARKRISAAQTGGGAPTPEPGPRGVLPNAALTKEKFWNDPVAAVEAMKTGLITKEEFAAQTASAQKTIIRMAEQLSRQDKDAEGQRLWMKYRNEINAIMNNLPADQQADPAYWDTAYNAVMGNHMAEIRSEAVTKATTIMEPGQTASEEPETPIDLSTIRAGTRGKEKTALDVCAGLGVSPDSYRKSMKEMNTGTLGMTLTNVGK